MRAKLVPWIAGGGGGGGGVELQFMASLLLWGVPDPGVFGSWLLPC